jgi:hypothetical protein
MKKKKIGLSLSFCIKDILNGKVSEKDVKKIVAGTKCVTIEDWLSVLDIYTETCWEGKDKGALLALKFAKAGKIYQPRTEGKRAPNISLGHWTDLRIKRVKNQIN